jgi:hypothetical protein
MSNNYKKLADVEYADNTENADVLVVVDGEVRRTEKGNIGGGSGDTITWSQIEDPPFGEETVAEYLNDVGKEETFVWNEETNRLTVTIAVTEHLVSYSHVYLVDLGIFGLARNCAFDGDNGVYMDEFTDSGYRTFITQNEDNTLTIEVEADQSHDGRSLYISVAREVWVFNPIRYEYLPAIENLPDATGETVTAAEFNALLSALRNAGYMRSE